MNPILILTGPTAVGKTSISIELAERLRGEIISADSRQIFRQINVGTAKPDPIELARVPHHFIDELDLGTPFSAGEFVRRANDRIGDILQRDRVPLVVGGSTLYLQALQFGLADIPGIDPAVRSTLMVRLETEGLDSLVDELKRVDPILADRVDLQNSHRIIRALEVFHGTGMPLSAYHMRHINPEWPFRTIVLTRDRISLYNRINQRVDDMIADGLVDEVKTLLEQGYDPQLSVLRTIGYSEVIAYLGGAYDADEMIRLIKRNSRRYAKRQMTWFNRFEGFEWVDADHFDHDRYIS